MGILVALIIALFLSLIISAANPKGSLSTIVILFLILFMTGVAAQFWIIPFGPVLWGIAWLPLLFIVLMFALLFLAPPGISSATAKNDQKEITAPVTLALNIIIGALLVLLTVAIIAGYYRTNI